MDTSLLEFLDNLYYKWRFHFGHPKYLYLGENTMEELKDEIIGLYCPQIKKEDMEPIRFMGMEVIKVHKDDFISFGFDWS